jgi:hypothetical protein
MSFRKLRAGLHPRVNESIQDACTLKTVSTAEGFSSLFDSNRK